MISRLAAAFWNILLFSKKNVLWNDKNEIPGFIA